MHMNPFTWLLKPFEGGPLLLIPNIAFLQFLPAIISGASAIAGGIVGKQKAPKAVDPLDPQAEQAKAIAGNMDQAGNIESLVGRANEFSQSQANGLMESAIPGWSKLSGKLMGLATESASNPYELPKDVQDNISRIAAERGVSTGVRGQAGEFSALRDLGLNSLEFGNSRIGQAQSILSTIAGLAPRVNPASPLSFYVTPGQQIDVASGNRDVKQGAENAKTAARNANASMWGDIISSIGGNFAGVQAGTPKT